MATRKLILTFCFIRLFLVAFLWATGTASSPMENVTLRVMYAVLSSSRNNRQSDPNSGLSAALEAARAARSEESDAYESGPHPQAC